MPMRCLRSTGWLRHSPPLDARRICRQRTSVVAGSPTGFSPALRRRPGITPFGQCRPDGPVTLPRPVVAYRTSRERGDEAVTMNGDRQPGVPVVPGLANLTVLARGGHATVYRA